MTETSYTILLFLLGVSLGSYINVLGIRYSSEDGFKKSNEGRSHCPHCDSTLTWLELIPLVSFLMQKGKCKTCRKRISFQYPIVEILSGLIFILIPMRLGLTVPAGIWIASFLVLLLITIIDLRLKLIPNELTALIVLLGLALIAYYVKTDTFGLNGGWVRGSFLRGYALTFWIAQGNIYLNYILGALIGAVSFGSIYILSRGRGMGFGDVKLATALGVLLGWPDVALALILSFLTGAFISLIFMFLQKKGLKDSLPFGPFMVLGVTLVFFFGYDILNGYFSVFGIL